MRGSSLNIFKMLRNVIILVGIRCQIQVLISIDSILMIVETTLKLIKFASKIVKLIEMIKYVYGHTCSYLFAFISTRSTFYHKDKTVKKKELITLILFINS